MIRIDEFGVLPCGNQVYQYEMSNHCGMRVNVLNYGGIIKEIWVSDNRGVEKNVVLSYDLLADYVENPAYLGALIGRTAGRIADSRLSIEGRVHHLDRNNGENSLHGGSSGFHQKLMKASVCETDKAITLILKFTSEHGEGGFPGKLELQVRYALLRNKNTLTVSFSGKSDRKTYLNMTNHSYFNLSNWDDSVGKQILELKGDAYAPVDSDMIPRDGWNSVSGTVFDFRDAKPIKSAISSDDPQILVAKGIDHPFRLNEGGISEAAKLHDPESGRALTVTTSQKNMVVYTGNFLDAVFVPSGKQFVRHGGVCFEAQEVPNAPNCPNFEGACLEAGLEYSHYIEYAFALL